MRNLPSRAQGHEKAAALAWYVRSVFTQVASSVPSAPDELVNETKLDPMNAAIVFGAMLANQGMEFRTRVYYGVPDYGWYPIIEILDNDGDHAWDPFTARFVPDYDHTPSSLDVALAGGRMYGVDPGQRVAPEDVLRAFNPESPSVGLSFRELQHYSWFELGRNKAALARHIVPLGTGTWSVGRKDGSSGDIVTAGVVAGDYLASLAYAGNTTQPIEPHNLAHQFVLRDLTPGHKYQLRLGTIGNNTDVLITVPDGLSAVAVNIGRNFIAADYSATATQATFSVAVRLPNRVSFDYWSWSRL